MKACSEQALLFRCDGDELPAVLAMPAVSPEIGVLVVVGGPQYRVGSHRQFVHLARGFAGNGVACMRFDSRGMGDAEGEPRYFDEQDEDIAAAIAEFRRRVPALRRVVLLGLCDGATASALYASRRGHVDGLILINPWVQTQAGVSRTVLRHYYARRVKERAMWRKLATGQLRPLDAARRFGANLLQSARSAVQALSGDTPELPARVAQALVAAGCPCLVALSGRDYVAREFEDSMSREAAFNEVRGTRRLSVVHVDGADHTFSNAEAAGELLAACARWLPLIDRAAAGSDT